MTDRIDIVERLRKNAVFNYRDTYIEAADEIERLRQLLGNTEQLRKERDEARRMYLASTCSDDEIIHEMKRHGWDCFKENTDDR